ncbi:hypothetical protein EXN66_Car001088 [Channa argus]|uniref:Uncharacterized protein n=1 Tax=Channa argus TaxID=215402 RepID=A0A6G1QZG2_CHAAH|nr:hypothetical protein EXN66_Car001088 [Channa argus]
MFPRGNERTVPETAEGDEDETRRRKPGFNPPQTIQLQSAEHERSPGMRPQHPGRVTEERSPDSRAEESILPLQPSRSTHRLTDRDRQRQAETGRAADLRTRLQTPNGDAP